MARRTIHLFMWGYQEHYRISLKLLAERVFASLGIKPEIKAFLVGVRRPDSSDPHPVCVEPEDGQLPLELFAALPDSVEVCIRNHPLQRMYYGDEQSMREKPEKIRRSSVSMEVKAALAEYDVQHKVRSFCGLAYPVDHHYVVPIIQIPEYVFAQFPPLREPIGDGQYKPPPSFVHAAIGLLLAEATDELQKPEPGRNLDTWIPTAEKIVRQAAAHFMRVPGVAIGGHVYVGDLFEPLNLVSSLLYEQTKGRGHLLLVNPENPAIEYSLRLLTPVPFREHRWVRKILQMASEQFALIADCEHIHGLGNLRSGHDPTLQDVFEIDFLDHYHWQLRCGMQALLRSRYGEPKLPQEPVSRTRFEDNVSRIFPQTSAGDRQRLWEIFKVVAEQDHGSMIVVAADAIAETRRLGQQGTPILPIPMTDDLLRSVSKIDGTIILDPHCVCHAVGVILDGPAVDACVPSRGARYNSGIRYICAADQSRMAIVVSDDRTVDILPMLRPKIDRSRIEKSLSDLETATLENYHEPRNFIDEHRFYFTSKECDRANAALDRIEKLPKEVGQIVIHTERLQPHPAMNDGYYM